MSQKIASLYAEISADTSKLQAGLAEAGGGLNKTKLAMMALETVGVAALGALSDGVRKAVKETLSYAATVRQLSRVSGAGAEDTSRMIQMVDDLGISLGDLETAMRGAAQKGVVVTTDNLARMSDEYLALAPGIERNTYLLDNFGRSGLNMAAVLSSGSQAIREMSGAVADNLVLTESQVRAARQLEIQLDTLNDAWTGIKTTIGMEVIPVMSTLVMEIGTAMQANTDYVQSTKESERSLVGLRIAQGDAIMIAQAAALATGVEADMQERLRLSREQQTQAILDQEQYQRDLNGIYDLTLSRLDELGALTGLSAYQQDLLALALGQTTQRELDYKAGIEAATQALANHSIEFQSLMDLVSSWDGTQFNAQMVIDVIMRNTAGETTTGESEQYRNKNQHQAYIDELKKQRATTSPTSSGTSGGYRSGTGGIDTAAREAERAAAEAAREAERQLQQKISAQQSRLSILIGGSLGSEETAYAEKMTEYKKQQAELSKGIAQYESASFLTGRQQEELAQLKRQLKEVNQEIKQSGDEHDKATKKILFNLLQQQLSLDGLTLRESDLLMGVAGQWGLVDQATLGAWKSYEGYAGKINDTNVPIEEIVKAITRAGAAQGAQVQIKVDSSIDQEVLIQEILHRVKKGY